jgi:hypothetical protein
VIVDWTSDTHQIFSSKDVGIFQSRFNV